MVGIAARGTPIEGYWCWWPYHGAEYARRFSTKEDALAYIPNVKTKHGKGRPLGVKRVMRVAFDPDHSRWSNDAPIIVTEEEVEAEHYRQQDEAADLRREQEAITEEVSRTATTSLPAA